MTPFTLSIFCGSISWVYDRARIRIETAGTSATDVSVQTAASVLGTLHSRQARIAIEITYSLEKRGKQAVRFLPRAKVAQKRDLYLFGSSHKNLSYILCPSVYYINA